MCTPKQIGTVIYETPPFFHKISCKQQQSAGVQRACNQVSIVRASGSQESVTTVWITCKEN